MLTSTDDLQWKIRRIMHLLKPEQAVGLQKIRVGNAGDGGYVMLDEFDKCRVAYSLGIGGDVSWDIAVAEHGLIIHQYDHTVSAAPSSHDNFRFNKRGIAASDSPDFVSLSKAIAANGDQHNRDMILKMDIEFAEWPVLDSIDPTVLAQFRQIVIEIHGLGRLREQNFRSTAERALAKLCANHAVFHVHANNWGNYEMIENVPVPDVLELSYIRRDIRPLVASIETFPTSLDVPCHPDRPDIVLGMFRYM